MYFLMFPYIRKGDILFCCQKKCFCYKIYSLCSKKYSFCSIVEHRIFHYIMQIFQYKHKCSKPLFVLFNKKMGLFKCGTSKTFQTFIRFVPLKKVFVPM